MLKMEGLESSSNNLNQSWRDILLNLSEDDEENDIINIWSQPIWFNYNTNRNGSVFIIEIIVIMVYYLLMILSLKIKSFLSYQTFQNKYLKGTNFHEIYAIVGVHDIKNDIFDRLKRDKKQCKYSYQLHLEDRYLQFVCVKLY
jgi:hypothetical protein